MAPALLIALVLLGSPAAPEAKSSWRAELTAAKFPAHLIEVTPRSNFAIVYGCDDAPVTLKLDGSHLAVAYFQGGRSFEVLDFQPGGTAGTYAMTLKAGGHAKDAPFTVQLKLLNPTLGIWVISGGANAMFTGRKTFIDEAQTRAVKTVRPGTGDCSTTRGSE